jgi:exonuclease III
VVKFLFWNLNRKPLQKIVADLAKAHDVDVLIFVECDIPPNEMLLALNESVQTQFHFPFSNSEHTVIYSRFQRQYVKTLFEEGDRISIRQFCLPDRMDIIIAAVHLPSKLFNSPESQSHYCSEVVKTVRDIEIEKGHSRTILVGDMNMNPFESGMVSANGFHGVMARNVARKGSRMVQKNKYQFFYNPMWCKFGDNSDGPPGTYYYARGEHVEYFWHMFDQVLIRPDLLDRFRNEDLRILTKSGSLSLVKDSGIPDNNIASDHLPIVFSLDI